MFMFLYYSQIVHDFANFLDHMQFPAAIYLDLNNCIDLSCILYNLVKIDMQEQQVNCRR